MAQAHPDLVGQRRHGPDRLIEADRSAVKLVRAFVGGQPIFPPIQREARTADAVGVTAHGGAEIGTCRAIGVGQIVFQRREPQHGLAGGSIAIRGQYRDDARAEVTDAHLETTTIAQGRQLNRAAVIQPPP